MINSNDESNSKSEVFALYQARLRAEEIEFAAREEHDQALQKLVENSYTKLNSDYETDRSKIDRDAKINFSFAKNQQRITILNTQREIVTKAMEVVRARLQDYVKTPEYKKTLGSLLKQGLLTLSEKEVKISIVPRDEGIIQDCLNQILSDVKAQIDCTVTIDKENPLPESAIGGVEISNVTDTIRLDNSLQARLLLASEGALPEIKKMLMK